MKYVLLLYPCRGLPELPFPSPPAPPSDRVEAAEDGRLPVEEARDDAAEPGRCDAPEPGRDLEPPPEPGRAACCVSLRPPIDREIVVMMHNKCDDDDEEEISKREERTGMRRERQ